MQAILAIAALLSSASTVAAAPTAPAPQDATTFALVYGFPLLAWEQMISHANGTNQFMHARTLQGADSNVVVKPNVDTLYSAMIFDLSHEDVVFSIPNIPSDQFALFSFYDPYSNNFAAVGPNNDGTAGSYRIVRRSDDKHKGKHDVGVFYNERPHGRGGAELKGTVVSPTTYGALCIRWLVNATNLESIHTYQDGITTRNVTRPISHKTAPSLSTLIHADAPKEPAARVLTQLARYSAIDGPRIASDAASVNKNLRLAGISHGTYTPPPDVSLSQANRTAQLQASSEYTSTLVDMGNGWKMLNLSDTGDYGTNYGIRTAVAASVYIAVKAPTAIYPDWSGSNNSATDNVLSGADSITIGPDESYLYTFSCKPPLKTLGFWSVTAYHNGYLIPNDRDVYTLGDRSNLTFPDGTPVYGVDEEKDGMFQILIQPADVAPPANWTNNWLPAPAGGGSMNAALRFYVAGEEVLNGSWEFPKVTKQAAFRGLAMVGGVKKVKDGNAEI